MLILGILLGLNEVSLYKINYYLFPIIDELDLLWHVITLNSTTECLGGKRIHAALILVSCDVPAARKLCRYILALVLCHRYEKSANYVNRKFNFSGIQNMDEWFIGKDLHEHWQRALEWRYCKSDAERK